MLLSEYTYGIKQMRSFQSISMEGRVMKVCAFVLFLLLFNQCRSEIISNASYFKIIEDGRLPNARLLWLGQNKDLYNRCEYVENDLNCEIIETIVNKKMIAVAFFDAHNRQLKLCPYPAMGYLLERALIKQLDPEASLPTNFDSMIRDTYIVEIPMRDARAELCLLY